MAASSLSGQDFRVGDWLVRPTLARIERGSEVVHVAPRSMAVLVHLAEAPGRVLSRNEILDTVWPGMTVTQDALSQCIVELRKAFRDDAKHAAFIETIPKVGLRLVAPVALVESHGDAVHAHATLAENSESGVQPIRSEAGHSSSEGVATLARRLVTTPAVPIIGITLIALGSAAFWFTHPPQVARRDPLASAEFTRLTDFVGAEEHAAISPDGRLVAFVSDRDGAWDVWLGQIGTGDFQNLTSGRLPELRNPAVRMLDFSPRGTHVLIWTKTTNVAGGAIDHGWRVPVIGGDLRPDTAGIAEIDWSPDGERVVYHPSAPGDPLVVARADETGTGAQIYVASAGIHCHFPLWSADGETIYFVQGFVPDEMDIWQIAANGGKPEKLTQHNSRVSFPMLLDERTLLYLATSADGSGPWLHILDLESRESRRVTTASAQYTSIATSADGRRIVATEAHPTASLWRVSVGAGITSASDAAQIPIRTQRGVSPRVASDFVVYRAPKAGTDALWKHEGAGAKELWSGVDGRGVAGPALAPDGQRVAFAAQRRGRTQLYVMNADGSGVHKVAEALEVRGVPTWSPAGDWIAIAALRDGEPRLFKIAVAENAPPIPLGDEYALDPTWSPTGEFIVYTGRDVGTTFEIRAVNADGTPYALPTLFLNRGSRRLDFLGTDENALVVLKGALSHKEFWVIDLRSGAERPLVTLGPGPLIGDFDVSADGRTLVFDRAREESDIVLIELRSSLRE
jgi:Tol biopolymer transport system component/DNA-binding winged helix-turn-helix (wHTH) protein